MKMHEKLQKKYFGKSRKKKDNIKKQHMFITNKPNLEIIK